MFSFRPAPWDGMAKIVTIFYIVICLWVTWMIRDVANIREFTIIVLILICIMIILYAFSPRHYVIYNDCIKITRLVGNIIIPYREIRIIERVDNYYLSRAIGSSGSFGYYGAWKNHDREKVSVSSTRLDHLVLITTEKQIYAISPDNPDYFVKMVQSHLQDKKTNGKTNGDVP